MLTSSEPTQGRSASTTLWPPAASGTITVGFPVAGFPVMSTCFMAGRMMSTETPGARVTRTSRELVAVVDHAGQWEIRKERQVSREQRWLRSGSVCRGWRWGDPLERARKARQAWSISSRAAAS